MFATTMTASIKLEWILNHVDGAQRAAAAGDFCFGTVDTWLAARLSGGALHSTDSSNGTSVQWLRDGLGILATLEESAAVAAAGVP